MKAFFYKNLVIGLPLLQTATAYRDLLLNQENSLEESLKRAEGQNRIFLLAFPK